MTHSRCILAASIGIALVSCASIKPYDGGENLVQDTNYRLGTEMRASVGSTMIRSMSYTETPIGSFKAPEDISFRVGLTRGKLKAGSSYPVKGQIKTSDGTELLVVQGPASTRLLVSEEGRISAKSLNQYNGYIAASLSHSPVINLEPVREVRTIGANEHNFEILYSGVDAGSIKMLYREYTSNNLARPSFFQTLSYDRSSETVRFRKIVMRVISAGSNEIVYVVEEDGLATPEPAEAQSTIDD